MKFTIDDTDKVYFPMKDSEMERNIRAEQAVMLHIDVDCFDRDGFEQWGDKTGSLFIWGHGFQQPDIKHLIRGTKGTGGRAAWEVAQDIADMGYPKGAGNEIIVWSCFAGVVGGFAQLLALYLTDHGYVGKKVWGCTTYTGTNVGKTLRCADTLASPNRIATLADVTYYIGA